MKGTLALLFVLAITFSGVRAHDDYVSSEEKAGIGLGAAGLALGLINFLLIMILWCCHPGRNSYDPYRRRHNYYDGNNPPIGTYGNQPRASRSN